MKPAIFAGFVLLLFLVLFKQPKKLGDDDEEAADET